MFDNSSLILHFARGIGAIFLIGILFFTTVHPIVGIALLIGAILLLRGCPVCWFIGLTDRFTQKKYK
jgi:hypothetical protein